MICDSCGSSEFFLEAYISYCKGCSSQVKVTSEINVDLSLSKKSSASSPSVKKASPSVEKTSPSVEETSPVEKTTSPSVEKTSKDKQQLYRPWITAEAFNVIIYQQVCALIKLGASPKLKDTVLHIWAKYLQKCEIAFREDYQRDEGIPRLGSVPAKRDLKALYGDKIVLAAKKQKKELNEPSTEESSTSGDESTQSSDTDTSSGTDSKPSKPKYSSAARKMMRKKKPSASSRSHDLKAAHNMNLPKTLSFCYLGLLYTEDRLSLSDFLRFTYEERIPYINLIDKLPSSFKLHSDTGQFLTYVVPDAHVVHKTSLNLVKFLNLPKFKEPSFFLAVSLYTKELNLPDDIKHMIKVIYDQYMEQLPNFPSIKPNEIPTDYLVIAFLLVVLKMLFVLDDKFEIEHSDVMTKLNAVKPDKKYFVWTEWKEQALLKEYLFLTENPGYGEINKLDSLSADRMISNYSFTHLKPLPKEDLLNQRSSSVKKREVKNKVPSQVVKKREVKNKVPSQVVKKHEVEKKVPSQAEKKHEVKNMLSQIVKIPSIKERAPTSFPICSKINEFINEWRTWHAFEETKDIDFTLLKKDFTTYSLSYNPLSFDSEEDELAHLLITSLYIPETSINTHLHFFKQCFSEDNFIRTSSNYWFLNSAQKPDTSPHLSDWIDKVPTSFRWLITYVCKHVGFKHVRLYKEMIQIEKIIFLNRKTIRPKSCNNIKVDL